MQIYETDDVWDLFDTSCDGPWQVQVRETFSSRKVVRTCGHNHHSWIGAKQCRKQKATRAEEGDARWMNAAIYPTYRTTRDTHKANGEPSSQMRVVDSENEPRVLHDPDKDREEELIMAALEELRKGTE